MNEKGIGRWIAAAGLLLAVGPALGHADEIDLDAYHAQRIAEVRAEVAAHGYDWTPGPTSMTRYTPEELDRMLGEVTPPEIKRWSAQDAPLPFPLRRDLPGSYDWREHDGVTPARHQGPCGSCWIFAAIGAIESAILIHGGEETDLSEQQILSCLSGGWGCLGGWTPHVWDYIAEYGAVSEACFPYEADDSVPCIEDQCDLVATCGSWADIPPIIEALKTAVIEYGPIKTGMYAYDDFHYYTEGCYEHEDVTTAVNHSVLIVGWDDDACSGEGAWLVKNSWGEDWGENGFVWMKYGTCNVGSNAMMVYYSNGQEIEYRFTQVDDGAAGDGDGWLDPGEEGTVEVVVRNGLLAGDRTAIEAQLVSLSPEATVLSGPVSCPDLEAGQYALLGDGFQVQVSPFAAIGSVLAFEVTISAAGDYSVVHGFELSVGDVPVLLVDDDVSTIADPFVRTALEEGGYLYRHWDTRRQGTPSGEVLSRYPAVVWPTGTTGLFEPDEQTSVREYLVQGGALLATGQDIGWNLIERVGATAEDRAFYREILHALYVADDSGFRHLDGVAGDPIADGLSFDIGGGDGSNSQLYPSRITPNAGAVACMEYAADVVGAVRYAGRYRVVYLAFGLEAVNTGADRTEILSRCLDWMVPQWPDLEQPLVDLIAPNGGEVWPIGEEATVSWTASDNVAVTGVDILLSRDGGATFGETLAEGLDNTGSFAWIATGPSSAQCVVQVTAHDGAGLMNADVSDDAFVIGDAAAVAAGADRAFRFGCATRNPFVETVRLHLALPASEAIDLGIYDLLGRRIETLHHGSLGAGEHAFVWNGREQAGGIYFARVRRPVEGNASLRLLLLR